MAEDKKEIELGHVYCTTRRRYELLRIDEVQFQIRRLFGEVDEAMVLVNDPTDAWEPDGEMEITITVKQKMKRKEPANPHPWRSCACDPATGTVCRAHASTCTCGHPGAGCICRG